MLIIRGESTSLGKIGREECLGDLQ